MNLGKVQSAKSLVENGTTEQCRWELHGVLPAEYAEKGLEL